jgi:hypothetical protein
VLRERPKFPPLRHPLNFRGTAKTHTSKCYNKSAPTHTSALFAF